MILRSSEVLRQIAFVMYGDRLTENFAMLYFSLRKYCFSSIHYWNSQKAESKLSFIRSKNLFSRQLHGVSEDYGELSELRVTQV